MSGDDVRGDVAPADADGDDAHGPARWEPMPRGRVVGLALRWGIGIGVGLGALAGTIVAPLLGTFFGAIFGLGVTAVPTVLGTAALFLAAKPGTSHDAFQRRVRLILVAIGVVVVGVGFALVLHRVGDEDTVANPFGGPVVLGVLLAPYLLLWANRSISAVEPAAAGVRDRSGLVPLAVAGLVVLAVAGRLVWGSALSPDARGMRAAKAERDRIAEQIGIGAVGAGSYVSSTSSTCGDGGGGDGYLSEGYADLGPGGVDDAIDRAEQALGDAGYDVSTGSSRSIADPAARWAYGLEGDRSVTVRASSDSVHVEVSHGCGEAQPVDVVEPAPMELLGASYVPIDPDAWSTYGELACEDGVDAEAQVHVAISRSIEGRGFPTWTTWRATTASGATATTSCVEQISGRLLAIGRLPGGTDDPVVRIELVDPDRLEVLDELPPEGRVLEVAGPDDGARLVRAELVETPVVGASLGEGCPDDVAFGVRVVWDRAIDLYDQGALGHGRVRAGSYRVDVADAAGELVEVVPSSLAEVNDADNSHLLCIATEGTPVEVHVAVADALPLQNGPNQAGTVGVLLR